VSAPPGEPGTVTEQDIHELTRWLATWWFIIGAAAALAVAALWHSPYGLAALAPWTLCQAVERMVAAKVRQGAR
jgi:hypothetical protein